MIRVETRPENREEIRRAVDILCAEKGISRSSYAVNELRCAPHTLKFLLDGKVRPASHVEIVRKLNKFTGATAEAWDR